jgi:predicted unusual protein kinase regulating ubiquinone biosynthesis (AarF/ABC1/UbiB family)
MSEEKNPTPSPDKIPQSRLRARYMRVTFFFAGVMIRVLWWDIILRHLGLKRLSRKTAAKRYQRMARSFRTLATRLGGVWIKVGQFLSARLDILPEALTSELAGLQDEVVPESFEAIRGVVEEAFDSSYEDRFTWFDAHPLASASLGQVHRARLHGGESVVVKIQRPGIHDILRIDLQALETVIGWLKRYRPIARRADLDALLQEFSRTLWEEVNYLQEAENARRFAAMYADDPNVRIPMVYASHTTTTVLTLEDVYFIKITDFTAIEAANVDLVEVADRLFHTYLQQIFVEGFFHADPHPGNLFVEPLGDGGWRLVFVDFGMTGQITKETLQALRDMAIAFGTRDIDRLMQAYLQLGVILPGADLERIRQAEASLLDRMWGKSMQELMSTHPKEMREFVREFRDVLFEMPFQIPENMIFLGRCVSILAGMCTGLNPEFNLFEGLRPFAQDLLLEEGSDWFGEVWRLLVEQARVMVTLPSRLDAALTRIEQGTLTVTTKASPELQTQLRGLTRAVNRLVAAVIFGVFLISSGWLYVNGEQILGAVSLGLSLVSLAWVLLK